MTGGGGCVAASTTSRDCRRDLIACSTMRMNPTRLRPPWSRCGSDSSCFDCSLSSRMAGGRVIRVVTVSNLCY